MISPRAEYLFKTYQNCVSTAVALKEAQNIVAMFGTPARARAYAEIQAQLGGHIPIWLIGSFHYRENATLSLRAYLGNGELIVGGTQRTSIAPVGRGPFQTFTRGGVDAFRHLGFDKYNTWTLPECLERAEDWNGRGYQNRGVPNPYIFSGTNAYVSGKFVQDNVYDPRKIDKTLGIAILAKAAKAG